MIQIEPRLLQFTPTTVALLRRHEAESAPTAALPVHGAGFLLLAAAQMR